MKAADAGAIDMPAPHLFVVSNLGQVRNAASTIRQLGLHDPHVLVLWTADATELRDRLLGAAAVYRVTATSLELPRSPTDPFPTRLRRIAALYDDLAAARTAPGTLWLANINSHYGYLARAFASAGAEICLFEEGLGTYRRAEDPAFGAEGLLATVRTVSRDVVSAARRDDLSVAGKVRRIGYRSLVGAFRTRAGRFISCILSRRRSEYFHEPRRRFTIAAVTFPDALDPRLVQARTVIRLEHREDVEAEVDAAAKRWLTTWPGRPAASQPVFLSQRYDVEPRRWARAIATVLRGNGYTALTVKFHPRETSDERGCLLDALSNVGIFVSTEPDLDRWPAENLLRAGLSCEVVGITSSALAYRAVDIPHRTIAPDLLQHLEADPAIPRRDLERLRQDTQLLLRVMSTVDAR